MTDIEITKACAVAMGYGAEESHGVVGIYQKMSDGVLMLVTYDPLHDDAQAMALEDYMIARGYLHYEDGNHLFYTWPLETSAHKFSADFTDKSGRRRAICECVANITSPPAAP